MQSNSFINPIPLKALLKERLSLW